MTTTEYLTNRSKIWPNLRSHGHFQHQEIVPHVVQSVPLHHGHRGGQGERRRQRATKKTIRRNHDVKFSSCGQVRPLTCPSTCSRPPGSIISMTNISMPTTKRKQQEQVSTGAKDMSKIRPIKKINIDSSAPCGPSPACRSSSSTSSACTSAGPRGVRQRRPQHRNQTSS